MKYRYLKILVYYLIPVDVLMVVAGWKYVNHVELFIFVILLSIYGMMWDIWATQHSKRDRLWIWKFNPRTTTKIEIGGQPIEEYVLALVFLSWIILFWELVVRTVTFQTPLDLGVLLFVAVWMVAGSFIIYRKQSR